VYRGKEQDVGSGIGTWRSGFLAGLLAGIVVVGGLARPTARAQAVYPPSAASVYGTDDRRLVSDTSQFPYSAIGRVEIWYGWNFQVASGVMIGRSVALTAGHVADAAGWRADVEFVPGATANAEPFGRAKVTKVIPAPRWAMYADDGYDMAILVLDRPIGDSTGYFQIAVQPDSFFKGLTLSSAGYPSDLGLSMYQVSGSSLGMDGNVLLHYVDSEPGQSGSPMWYGGNDAASARLVAILEGSYLRFGVGEVGIAARINQTAANWIEENLALYKDVAQGIDGPDDSGDAVVPTYGSMCGFGTGQALFGGGLGLLGMMVSRRRR
jgi:V8-like Glu-specific endopeptidase